MKETIPPVEDSEKEDEEEENLNRLVFQQMDSLVVRAGTIKSHMKDCSRQLYWHHKSFGKKAGDKVFYNRVANGIFMAKEKYWIPILDAATGSPVTRATDLFEKPIHVQTRMGPRSAIKVIDFVTDARFDFRVTVLGGCVSEEELRFLFEYGGEHGYGGERGDGEGRYELALLEKE